MDKRDLLETIRKLQAKADSSEDLGLEAEAIAFAAKVQELLLKNKLSMSDVMFERLDEDDPFGESIFDFHSQDVRATSSRLAWRERLLFAVCRAHFCKALIGRQWSETATRKGSGYYTIYHIIGRQSDRQVCIYMLAYLINTVEQLAKRGYREQRRSDRPTRGFKISFYYQFALVIRDRYLAMEETIKRVGLGEISSGVALVRVNQSRAQVRKWVADHYQTGKAKSVAERNGYNPDGMEAGRRAGENVNLRKGGIKGRTSDQNLIEGN